MSLEIPSVIPQVYLYVNPMVMGALRSFAQEAGERIAGLQVFCLPLALIFLSFQAIGTEFCHDLTVPKVCCTERKNKRKKALQVF